MTQTKPFLFTPAPDRAELLFEDRAESPHISVYQQDDIRWLGFGGPAVQSVMSVARPDALLLPYTHAMLTALLFVREPRSLLNLGLGGGAFERFFRHRLPEIAVTSVEQDARVAAIAMSWFLLDPAARCAIAPAHAHVAQTADKFDLIFCDLHGSERMARELSDPEFWRDCAQRLRAGGAIALNAIADSGPELLGLLKALQASFPTIALCEIVDHRNLVVFALPDAPPDHDTLVTRREAMRVRTRITLPIDAESLRFVGN